MNRLIITGTKEIQDTKACNPVKIAHRPIAHKINRSRTVFVQERAAGNLRHGIGPGKG